MIGTNVIVIPAKSQMSQQVKRQLRVAAYCRVSTDDEEQLTSYEAQQTFYTDKIMENPDWTMAGIFADEGITGTSARKRPEFLRMIRQCKQRKIDLILARKITRAMEKDISPIPGEEMSLADIEKRLEEIDQEVGQLIAKAANEGKTTTCQDRLEDLLEETIALKGKRAFLQEQREKDSAAARRIGAVVTAMEQLPAELTQWEESTIRQLVDTVKVLSKDKILVCLRCGAEIEQEIEA